MFRPAVVVLISAGTAVLYGTYLLKRQTVGLDTFRLSGTFLYLVPIVVPFVAFLVDRAEHINKTLDYRVNQSFAPTGGRHLQTSKKAVIMKYDLDV